MATAASAAVSLSVNHASNFSDFIASSDAGRGGKLQRVRGTRLTGRRSGFLGDSLRSAPCSELWWHGGDVVLRNWEIRAGCSPGRGSSGKVFFIPFGPGPGGRRRHGASDTFAGREWEKRSQRHHEKVRQIIEKEMKAWQKKNVRSDGEELGREAQQKKNDDSSDSSNYESPLLRELKRRLRAEEEASVKSGVEIQDKHHVDGAEGTKTSSEPSTIDLMKELEKRLREEREGNKSQDRENTQESSRESWWWRTGNVSSLYDFMRDYEGLREKKNRLEELWKTREGRRRSGEDGTQNSHRHGRSARKDCVSDAKETKQNLDEGNPRPATVPKYPQSDRTVVYLKNEGNGAEIFLVGTSHVSSKSVTEVREVIERVKPDFVMVELCRKRYEGMVRNSGKGSSGPMAFVEQMLRMLTNGNVGAIGELVGIGLTGFYRLLNRRFHPGKEFQVAIEVGKSVGAKIVLGDQDIDTTLKHLGDFNLHMSMQDALKNFGQKIPQDLADAIGEQDVSDMFERMRDRKIVRRFNEEMEKGAPAIAKVLLTERNEVMIKAMRNLTGKVVAVVGLAHMDGIEQLWHEANDKYFSEQSTQSE